jgi:anhydro-N-acetylmuramic acid kinase
VLALEHTPYPETLRDLLLKNSTPDTSSVIDLSQLNVRLAHVYAGAVREAARTAGLALEEIDLVGSHGQTVYHVPEPTPCSGQDVTSTLQIGDPSVLANLLRIPVVGDFRVADMALGGQGAPLVPYFDYIYFADARETRGLLNLGGIANLTVLPAGAGPEAVYAFDTGPSNMIIDALARRLYGKPYDDGGRLAAQGSVQEQLLASWLDDPYFAQPPPKSTGREYFGQVWLDAHLNGQPDEEDPADLLATATQFTARTIYDAYVRYVQPRHRLDVLIASGGGRQNARLMDSLAALFAPAPVRPIDDYGIDAAAKEALCFAVLAHECINGAPTNMTGATGAARPTLLGKICIPL